jgi:hypothetical protein
LSSSKRNKKLSSFTPAAAPTTNGNSHVNGEVDAKAETLVEPPKNDGIKKVSWNFILFVCLCV